MKPASMMAMVLLTAIAAVHVLRIVFGVEVVVGETVVPMWVSAVGTLVTGGVAILLWREGHPRSGATV